MKWLKLIITIACFLYCEGELCEALIAEAKNEGSLRDLITKEFDHLKNESVSCIESLVLTGNYKALESYTAMLNDNGIKFRQTLSQSVSNIKSKLEAFTEDNERVDTLIEPKKVMPAFRWAQSMERIFVQVKFSYRFDYPSCENIESLSTRINESRIAISGKCDLSDVPVIFNLDLPLLELIDKDNSLFKNERQGPYFDLKKKESKYWPQLISEEKKKDYPQMSIWYEMKAKYESELKEYEAAEEEQSYEEIEKELKEQMNNERKNKRKAKRKKKKKTVQSDL